MRSLVASLYLPSIEGSMPASSLSAMAGVTPGTSRPTASSSNRFAKLAFDSDAMRSIQIRVSRPGNAKPAGRIPTTRRGLSFNRMVWSTMPGSPP